MYEVSFKNEESLIELQRDTYVGSKETAKGVCGRGLCENTGDRVNVGNIDLQIRSFDHQESILSYLISSHLNTVQIEILKQTWTAPWSLAANTLLVHELQ